MHDDDHYRQLADFVRRVRHDVSNPLTAALGNVQLILEDADGLETDVADSLRTVESELRRLSALLRQLDRVDPASPPPSYPADPQP